MRAVTINQPWAHAILRGWKTCENRTWATSHRGPLAIHASNSRAHLNPGWELLTEDDGTPFGETIVFGAIVCVVDLVACVPLSQVPPDWQGGEYPPKGPWCWLLDNVRPLTPPIKCKGAQRLWTPPADVLARLTAAGGAVLK